MTDNICKSVWKIPIVSGNIVCVKNIDVYITA